MALGAIGAAIVLVITTYASPGWSAASSLLASCSRSCCLPWVAGLSTRFGARA